MDYGQSFTKTKRMLIYGTRATLLTAESIPDKCESCGKINSIQLSVFQKYAHVFWIPFFPIGKTGISQCAHCQQILQTKQMPPSLKDSFDGLKTQTKAPLWTFVGAALLVGLIATGIYQSKQNDKRNAALVQSPQAGDVFEIKSGPNQYTLYKVDHIAQDSVFVRFHAYETNRLSGLADLKSKKDQFSSETMVFSKSALKTMLDKGEIIDIDR